MCGEEVFYYDIHNIPTTCGRRMCTTNYKYMVNNADPRDGSMKKPEDIKKWQG